jgi:hypothetical protein
VCAYLYHPVLTTLAVLSLAGYLWTGSRTMLYALTAIVVGGAFWLSIRPSFCG